MDRPPPDRHTTPREFTSNLPTLEVHFVLTTTGASVLAARLRAQVCVGDGAAFAPLGQLEVLLVAWTEAVTTPGSVVHVHIRGDVLLSADRARLCARDSREAPLSRCASGTA